jgi:outer membrane protein OmpA-like peptidoglycan-associated protein
MSLDPIIGHGQGNGGEDPDGHWISVSDLMSGLMVVFLFIAISYIQPVIETQEKVREIVGAWKDAELEIDKELQKEFSKDLARWQAELDSQRLAIRFKAPDALFEPGKSNLKPEFTAILDDFFPRYLRVLHRFAPAIDEVRIEGHTSTAWTGAAGVEDAYFRNMALSQERTRAVLQYGLQRPELGPIRDWVRSLITANGLSSSQSVRRPDGSEDEAASRRVEFRVVTRSKEQIVRILETVK